MERVQAHERGWSRCRPGRVFWARPVAGRHRMTDQLLLPIRERVDATGRDVGKEVNDVWLLSWRIYSIYGYVVSKPVNRSFPAQIRQGKVGLPIATKGCAEERKECGFLANGKELPFTRSPPLWRKIEGEE